MRTTTAYFVGAGTVVAAIAAGLGGGLLIANAVSPTSQGREMTRLEQRMAPKPAAVIASSSEPAPYLAATQAAAVNPIVVAPAPQGQAGSQTEAANNKPAELTVAAREAAPPAQPAVSNSQSAALAAPPREQAAAPEDSLAKTRDVDMKRAAAEKRRTERRQHWADKRRYPQRQDEVLRDVEQKVREETEPTEAVASQPVKLEMPRIHFLEAE